MHKIDPTMSNKINLFKPGDTYQHSLVVTPDLMKQLLQASGDANPIHLDHDYAVAHGFRGVVVYGNLLGLILSHLVGMKLPTKEVIILSESLEFRKPSYVGDEIRLQAIVTNIYEALQTIELRLTFLAPSGDKVCTGKCLVKCV
ncbi:MAG: MaoC/PaaZ C-terminal domain-containing protein [Burkholderiales bacterium]